MPTGLTENAGWEIGVSRTLSADVGEVWALLTSPDGLALWLGGLDTLPTELGEGYTTTDGGTRELRSRQERERVRLTWRPPGGEESTVQVTVSRAGEGRTLLRFHQERLRDAGDRNRQRVHWRSVVDALQRALAG
jgi:uncharacterized protein YndB with AHSA1/START domain